MCLNVCVRERESVGEYMCEYVSLFFYPPLLACLERPEVLAVVVRLEPRREDLLGQAREGGAVGALALLQQPQHLCGCGGVYL